MITPKNIFIRYWRLTMKKLKLLLIGLTSISLLAACSFSQESSQDTSSNNDKTYSVIVPNGTPSLALANFYDESDSFSKVDVVAGSDPLVAAFTSKTYDIIVAPTNLGARFYNNSPDYLLYKTIVWGNLYLVSNSSLTSFEELNNKSVTLFGMNTTPDIIMKTLISYYDINVELNYVDDVQTANSMLVSSQTDIIVSAEPSLSKIRQNKDYYVMDLQEEYSNATNLVSYPQASVFFKKELQGEIDSVLQEIAHSVTKANEDPSQTAKNAVSMDESFASLGETVLIDAIPNCHFGIEESDKEAIEGYFNHMNTLGLSAQYGGKLPGEEFYYSI